jgi:hypothetical protein
MTYKDNTPTFNINRKVVNFKDFNKDSEETELKKIKRQNKPNSERQKLIGNPRAKYNKVTHKLDFDLNPAYIEDKIDSVKESIDETILNKIQNSVSYEKFAETLKIALMEFSDGIKNDDSIGFDENNSIHNESLKVSIQEALNQSKI